MPKTNDASGATYAGYEGVVEHAGGFGSTRPGGLSQLDPSRNVDGTVVDEFDSEEREISDREGAVGADFAEVHPVQDDERSEEEDQERQDADAGQQENEAAPSEDEKGGEQESAGRVSALSSARRARSGGSSSRNSR